MSNTYATPEEMEAMRLGGLLRAGTADEKWLQAQIRRIAPDWEEQGDRVYSMAMESLVFELRDKLDKAQPEARGAACTGMTRRDHFAGLAMQGDWATHGGFSSKAPESIFMDAANRYYRMADAMLKARNGGVET